MLLSTLGPNLLGNLLTGKGIIRGIIKNEVEKVKLNNKRYN